MTEKIPEKKARIGAKCRVCGSINKKDLEKFFRRPTRVDLLARVAANTAVQK